ncbi:MAG: PEP/pyruvate-binding domain-containing protein [Verrucomicrobiota bacterium]
MPLREAHDARLVGGKAINLAKLLEAGLPVPDGFVVTTSAYREARGSDQIPAEIQSIIRKSYAEIGSPTVAVRSSATAEDGANASMAGQYETFLNLSSADDLLDAISKCWASTQSERVLSYLAEKGVEPNSVEMAVVVQELVPAEAAGVLFTANPQTGADDEMVVEAAWGLGEAIVSGAVQPDRIRLDRQNGCVLDYAISDKKQKLDPEGRAFETVEETKRRRASVSFESLQQLWQLGKQVVDYFGAPQDIEWALADGKVFLLQARNITQLREASVRHSLPDNIRQELCRLRDGGYGPWVRHNLDETLPFPSPLTWSILGEFMSGRGGFGQLYRDVGFAPSAKVCEEGFLKLIGGRVYMDCSLMPEMFAEGYPFAYDMDVLRDNPDAAQNPPTLPKGGLKKRGDAALQASRVTKRLHEIGQDLDRRFEEDFRPRVLEWCKQESARDLTSLDAAELGELWEQMRATVFGDFGVMAFLPSMVEALASADLQAFLDDYSWEEAPTRVMNEILVSPQLDQTALLNKGLQELGRGELGLQAWIEEFGQRGPGEFDLSNARWADRPEEINAMAKRLAPEESIPALHKRRCEQADETLARVSKSLTVKKQRELADKVNLARRYLRFREDGKDLLMRAFGNMRRLALEIGNRIEVGEDVFLMTGDEMLEGLATGFIAKDRIEQRRILRKAEAKLVLPRVIDRDDIETLGVPQQVKQATAYDAHSLSAGISTGNARVLQSPEQVGELGEDYILVCPSTDPAWTPLFVGASGLIMERGGSLSHGAIVARELGLPAVVVEDATRMIKDGDRLTIDAHQGRIFRGEPESTSENLEEHNSQIEHALKPPSPGVFEKASGGRGVIVALGWVLFLSAMWLFPASWLKDPLFRALDVLLWPLVSAVGMPKTVAVIAIFFAILPLVLQKYLTDNRRLLIARDRANALRKKSRQYPEGSPRREAMEHFAAPITNRVLKAALIPLAYILGPMMLIFFWLPERLDPASWNAEPGQTVSVVAEVDGDWQGPISLEVPEPLQIDSSSKATQTLPPIRETLQKIRSEWARGSEMKEFPWELQASAAQAHQAMLASLDSFLASPLPAQTISWRVRVPQEAGGQHRLQLSSNTGAPVEIVLAFGKGCPPAPAEMTPPSGPIQLLKAVYPRALQKQYFWAPFKRASGTPFDFGWLGVYILAYLPTMLITKKLLKIP